MLSLFGSMYRRIANLYTAEAVTFDGTNDGLSRGGLTGGSTTNKFTFATWCYFRTTTDLQPRLYSMYLDTTNRLQIRFTATAGVPTSLLCWGEIANVGNISLTASPVGNTFIPPVDEWFHVIFSFDGANSANSKVICNGKDHTNVVTNTAANYNFATWNQNIGQQNGGTRRSDMDLAETYFTDEWIDLSVQANIEKFIKDGAPVSLGSDGSKPSGTQPLVYMAGDAAAWNGTGNNLGSGGDFTVAGALTNSTEEPVALTATAVQFDGVNDYMSRPALTGAVDGKFGSFSAWMYFTANTLNDRIVYFGNSGTQQITFYVDANGNFVAWVNDGSGTALVRHTSETTITLNKWHHIAICYDTTSGSLKSNIYIDDEQDFSTAITLVTGDADYTVTDYVLMGKNGGTNKVSAHTANLWFSTTEYVDFTDTATRRKFITSTGEPVWLGEDGSTPTGTSPIIFLNSVASALNTAGTNSGTGGAFAMSGAVDDSSVKPILLSDYVAQATFYDGVTDSLNLASGLTNVTDGKTMSWSVWMWQDSSKLAYTAWAYRQTGEPGNSIQGGIFLDTAYKFRCFWETTGAASVFNLTATDAAGMDGWHHFMGSVDTSDPTNKTHFYVDGVAVAYTGVPVADAIMHYPAYASTIATNIPGAGTTYKGHMCDLWWTTDYIDLSVQANREKFISGTGVGAAPVYLGYAGQLPTSNQPQLFLTGEAATINAGSNAGNGGDFTVTGAVIDSTEEPVEVSAAPYVPQAVDFDGTAEYMHTPTRTNYISGKQYTISFWIYSNTRADNSSVFSVDAQQSLTQSTQRVSVFHQSTGEFYFNAKNSTDAIILQSNTTSTFANNRWHHVLFSVDLATTTTQCYVNGVSAALTNTTRTNDTIDGQLDYSRIGLFQSTLEFPIDGDLCDIWWTNTYIDLSVQANREKFILGGAPVFLGDNGELPTGSNPKVFMTGDAASWNTGVNTGTAANYTVVGSLSDSVNEPVELP